MQLRLRSGWAVAVAALVCLGVVGCGTKVQGHTYSGNGNVVSVEFQSGGKAYASMGPMTSACTYTQSGKTVNLVCEGDTTVLTLQDDGSLNGPPEGMLAHMTKVK